MMWLTVPFVLGALTILQTGLNRRFGEDYGLSVAVAVNGAVLCAVALLVIAVGHWQPQMVPDYVRAKAGDYRFELWHLIPGVFGFLMVFFMPWALRNLGAAPVFMAFVTAQLLGSLLWDYGTDGQVAWPRVAGVALCLLGVFVFNGFGSRG